MRKRSIGIGVMAACALLAGCGTGKNAAQGARALSPRLIAATANTVTAARSARVTITVAFDLAGRAGRARAEGSVDFARHAARFTMDLDALGSGLGTSDVIVADDAFYFNADLLAKTGLTMLRGGDAKWVKLDIAGYRAQMGSADGLTGVSNPAGFADLVAMLRGISGAVTTVGHDVIAGSDTTHYRATVDIARALRLAPAGERATAARALDAFSARELPVDVWVDGDGYVRRLVVDLAARDIRGASGNGHVVVTVDLLDFGTAAAVNVPAASETIDLLDLLGGPVTH